VTSQSSEFWRAALDSLTAHVALLDEHGTILAVNQAWRRFATHNDQPHPDACIGVNYLAVCEVAAAQEPHAASIIAGIHAVLEGRLKEFFTSYPCHSPHRQRWFMLRITPFQGPGPARLVMAHENITAPKEAQIRAARFAKKLQLANKALQTQTHELARAEEREADRSRILELVVRNELLETILQEIALMVEHHHPNLCCAVLVKRNGASCVTATAKMPVDRLRSLSEHRATPCNSSHFKGAYGELLSAGDAPSERQFLILPIQKRSEPPVGYLAVTDRQSNEPPAASPGLHRAAALALLAIEHAALDERLSFQAHHDLLAGIPNRAGFRELLEQAVAVGKRQNTSFAVLTLNVDRFRNVNDAYGHRAGDVLLRQVAQRLVDIVGPEDTVARMGGDEFAIVSSSCQTAEAAEAQAQRICTSFAKPFAVLDNSLQASCRVGITMFPQDATEATCLVRNADAAISEIKQKGRSTWRRYNSDLGSAANETLEIERHLQNAIANNELQLHYQPQLDAHGHIVGVEALMRWNSPALGSVSPVRFIPLAEQTGIILDLGAWALTTACLQWLRWQAAGLPPMQLAVNTSAVELCSGDYASRVQKVIDQTGMDPAYLELEVTESSMMASMKEAIVEMEKVRALGVRMSIDDFGTGYSSLSYLQMLPVNTVKIDRSFVRDLNESSQNAISVVRAIITLAHSLNLTVIAEGVETEAQMQTLSDLNCDVYQGYLFHRPLDVDTVGTILEKSALSQDHARKTESLVRNLIKEMRALQNPDQPVPIPG
jgi:diguanylate cyclase (GGDEF)-like protein